METGRRNNKILKLREEKIGFDGLSDKELWDLGFDHWEYSEMDQAERYFTKLLKHEKNLIKERRLDLKMKLAKIYFSEKKLEKTTELIYNILLKEDPKYSPAYLLLGEILASIRDWEGLEYISRKVESIGKPQGTGVVNDVEYKVIPKRMMLTSLVARGRYEEALKVLQDIMQIIPDNPQLMAEYHNITHEKDRVEFVGAYARINKYLEKTNEIDKSPHLLELIPKDMKDDNLINQLKGEITFDIARKKKVKLKGEKTIEFYCGGHLEKWDGNSDIKKGIGGSEGMVIIMARELAKLGNKVTVYNESDGKVIDGVHYENWQKWKPENKCDVYIGLRSAGLESMKTFIEAKKQYLYLHDTYYGNYPQLNFNMFNKVLVLSNYHKQVIKEQHGIKDDTIFHVTRNSFNDKAIPKKMPVRNKNKFIYASSYDRGLDSLLMSWARIKEALPYAELHIYYGWDTYDALAQARGSKQMIEYKDNVLRLLKQKDVFEHGRVTQKELYKAFAESNAWLYPTTFTEVSCITAMQSQLLGAIPITTPSGALPETVNKKYGVIVDQKNFVDAVVQTVGNYSEDKRNKMMEWANETYNPVGLAKDWDNLFNSLN
jgi:glycosyltransferase involved in cell wall biosynthesis